MTIVEFLSARLHEYEMVARKKLRTDSPAMWDNESRHPARSFPRQWLAEVKAKRQLLDQWADRYSSDMRATDAGARDARRVLHALATIYDEHPDFCEEWRLIR